jgi:ABC-type transporter Mla subunit MlaD
MLQDNDVKGFISNANVFFSNYSQQAPSIRNISQSLAELTGTLSDVAGAIDRANAQAKASSDSSVKLATSLNRITLALVGVGLLQVIVALIQAWHH